MDAADQSFDQPSSKRMQTLKQQLLEQKQHKATFDPHKTIKKQASASYQDEVDF